MSKQNIDTHVKRGTDIKLAQANSNYPRTQEEKDVIIENATKAYEVYLDALGFDWREDPNSDNTPFRVAKAFVNLMGLLM